MTEPPVDPTEPAPEGTTGSEPQVPDTTRPPEPPAPPAPSTPPPPSGPAPQPAASRAYDEKRMWLTAGITVAICALATWLTPFTVLAIPLVLIGTLFFISKDNSPTKRATVAGIALGCGVGLIVSAGVCVAVLSSNVPSPFYPGL